MTLPKEKLPEGAIDMHVHPLENGEFSVPLVMDTIRGMKEAGMSGVLLKPHFVETTLMSELADEIVSDFDVFGGLILEHSAGGINPNVVADQIENGAKKIWMSLMTQNFWDNQLSHPRGYLNEDDMQRMEKRHGPFWSYLNENGEIKEEIRADLQEVLEIIADADVIFDTGHASPEESIALVEEAKKVGVDKVVVDHPVSVTKQATIEQQKEMAEMGAYMEQSWAKMQPSGGAMPPEKFAEAIKAVGAEKTVLVSDYAAGSHPPPAEAMREYIVTLNNHGISDSEIELMIKENPRELLNL